MGNRSSYPPGTRDLKRGASTLVDRARAGDLHTTRMDLQLSAAHLRFRNALRAWLAANLPRPWREELREPGATETSLIELRRAWQKKLYQAGYLGMDWPHEWGGRGGTEVEKSIMEAELARADAPPILNILGVDLLGPALIHHGSDAKDRYGGISFILVKLDTPGVSVRPLRQITGESEFGEVFFEDARVPRESLVGQIGEGWRIAMTVLGYERGVGSLANSARYGRDLARLAAACRELGRTGTAVREKLGRLLVENEVMRANGIRALANLADGRAPGPESSLEKLYWSEFDKRFRETALDLLGPAGQLLRTNPAARADVDWAREFLWSRAGTIYSGSSEVQRNIIAKR